MEKTLTIDCNQCGAIIGVTQAKESFKLGALICPTCELENETYNGGKAK